MKKTFTNFHYSPHFYAGQQQCSLIKKIDTPDSSSDINITKLLILPSEMYVHLEIN